MQQTILPQAPAKTSQSEVGAAKSQGRKDPEAGDSRFDELSRAEQKRMDAKRAERRDQADAAQERKAADRADEKAEASGTRPEKNDTPTDQKQVADSDSPARPSSASDTSNTGDTEADDALVVAQRRVDVEPHPLARAHHWSRGSGCCRQLAAQHSVFE